jgi:uncharacterized protein
MLAVAGQQEFRKGLLASPGKIFKTSWVRIDDPTQAHANAERKSDGCFEQGRKKGGAVFTRLEGIYQREREIFFTATDGGDMAQGQVFVYHPDREELALVYESTDKQVMTYPDAIERGPAGGHIICQDGKDVFPQVLYFLSKDGQVTPLASNNATDPEQRKSEWSGCSMSPDGKWLFANVYNPGYTVAITGPFEAWAGA